MTGVDIPDRRDPRNRRHAAAGMAAPGMTATLERAP